MKKLPINSSMTFCMLLLTYPISAKMLNFGSIMGIPCMILKDRKQNPWERINNKNNLKNSGVAFELLISWKVKSGGIPPLQGLTHHLE